MKPLYYLDNRAQLKSVTSGKHLFNDILCWLLMRFISAFVAPLVHLGRFKSGHDFLLEVELTPDKTTPTRAKRILFDCPFIVKLRPLQSENSKFTLSRGKVDKFWKRPLILFDHLPEDHPVSFFGPYTFVDRPLYVVLDQGRLLLCFGPFTFTQFDHELTPMTVHFHLDPLILSLNVIYKLHFFL